MDELCLIFLSRYLLSPKDGLIRTDNGPLSSFETYESGEKIIIISDTFLLPLGKIFCGQAAPVRCQGSDGICVLSKDICSLQFASYIEI